MNDKLSRQFCCMLAVILTVVLSPAADSGSAAKKPVQYEWSVTITDDDAFHLLSDCDSSGCDGTYTDTGNVLVRVDRQRKHLYSFFLRVEGLDGRKIGLRDVTLSGMGNPGEGSGCFPEEGCGAYDDFCENTNDCTDRLEGFLNRLHPDCGYAYVALKIDVSLDIESMEEGEEIYLGNDDLILLTIYHTNADTGDPSPALYHNMQAQNVAKNATSRYSPLRIVRMGSDTWKIRVEEGEYMNYYEFYYAPLGRGEHLVPQIPLAGYGPFNFEMTWTRSPAGD